MNALFLSLTIRKTGRWKDYWTNEKPIFLTTRYSKSHFHFHRRPVSFMWCCVMVMSMLPVDKETLCVLFLWYYFSYEDSGDDVCIRCEILLLLTPHCCLNVSVFDSNIYIYLQCTMYIFYSVTALDHILFICSSIWIQYGTEKLSVFGFSFTAVKPIVRNGYLVAWKLDTLVLLKFRSNKNAGTRCSYICRYCRW